MTKEEILEAIENMTVLELSELVKAIEERFDVSAAAAPVMMAGGMVAAGGDAGGSDEQTEFDVVLVEAGQQKIPVIKAVKEITGLGLKEAKELVDALPKPVKTKVSRDEAEEIKEKLSAVGAVIDIK
ncbi:MAG TPA: 50S ribosomal protein L7/L12 [Caldisericia bacterium]|nr:50S ribosomal protein L7/L12 [Caldisericia bacterium]HPF48442.1 50S ribosomal protein L7/L12 [Caldisericia bacterium]HPI83378.1 50S ribosomal protein L7/L12 [Caldisericia bacterium]HPQ92896.1 50S ribosomal protein L7/L12 [Caldisericia bacterium]HRV74006.1 50S ribosomal protein L7/L12 [Caldisericia bacterium]